MLMDLQDLWRNLAWMGEPATGVGGMAEGALWIRDLTGIW